MVELLWQVFREAESSGDVRLIVLKGAGDRAFCAGTVHALLTRTRTTALAHDTINNT
jgi:enoyl-CoA hydratase/carnithine racemase